MRMLHCHCSMCRKHHGSAFATFVTVPSSQFKWVSGEVNVANYQPSPEGARAFCRVCGSVAPTAAPELGLVFLPAGNLDGELGIEPQGHMFVGSKAPWYTITDDLPQHDEYPPEFVGAVATERPALDPPSPGIVRGSCLCGDVAFALWHALFGVATQKLDVDSPQLPAVFGISDFHVNETSFAMAFGGGIDIKLNDRIDIRAVQVDWNIITRGDQQLGIVLVPTPHQTVGQPFVILGTRQDNLRLSVGIVIH